jgi:hypothetical protein
MNSSKPASGFARLLVSIVPWIEATCTVALIIGIAMLITSGEETILAVSLPGLALCYFLSAYLPPSASPDDTQSRGFVDLLAATILPKVLWISSAVATMGVFFAVMKMEGMEQMLLIGVLSLCSCVALLVVCGIIGKPIRPFFPILLRALPVLAVALYFLLSSGRV